MLPLLLKNKYSFIFCNHQFKKIMFKQQFISLAHSRYPNNIIKHLKPNEQDKSAKNKDHPENKKNISIKQEIQALYTIRYALHTQKTNHNNKNTNQVNAELDAQSKGQFKFQIKAPKGTRDFHPHQMAIRRKVIDTVSKIFKKHGAVQIDTPVFELKQVLTGKYGQDSKLIYDLDDQGGQKCSLRYDLTVPFARFMANNTNIQKIKRFHIGKVYRRDQPTANKGRYRQFYQCDFDIAGRYDPMIPDAEVLVVMQQILEALDIKDFIVKINHRKILQAMVECSGQDLSKFKTICSSIDKLDKQPWKQIRQQLIKQKNIKQSAVDILQTYTKFKGQPFKILQKLVNQDIFKQKGTAPLNDMRMLFNYLKSLKFINKVSFDLSLARGLDYYTGVIFQIVLTDKKSQLGSISGGGRYDDLIGMFSQHQIPSVGGSIGIERLFNILQNNFKGKVKTNQTEVLVATIGPVQVSKKLQILGQLWSIGIKAETLYVSQSKAGPQMKHALDNQIPFILWIGESQLQSGFLNLKILYKRQEIKIGLNNLADISKYVEEYKNDFQKGLVKFEQPNKKKK